MRRSLLVAAFLLLSALTTGGTEYGRAVWEKDPDSRADRYCIGVNWKCHGLIDSSGKVIVLFEPGRSQEQDFFNDRMPLGDRESGKDGYIDSSGRWAIPPRFLVARRFHDGFAIVRESRDSPWHFIDVDGRQVGPSVQYGLEDFSHGLAPVRLTKEDRTGYIDETGEWAIPPRFQKAARFSPDGIAAVQDANGLWGFIDVDGKYLIQPRFDLRRSYWSQGFHEGRNAVEKAGDCWSRAEDERVDPLRIRYFVRRGEKSEQVESPPDGLEQCGFIVIDTAGEPVSDVLLTQMEPFSGGAAAAQVGRKWGLLGRNGQWISPPVWKKTTSFSEGLAAVQNDEGYWGYVNRKGEVVIEPQYQMARAFSEGLAVVYGKNRKAFYIRPDGSRAFDREFAYAGRFQRGIANVALQPYRSFAYIDKAGKTVFEYSNLPMN